VLRLVFGTAALRTSGNKNLTPSPVSLPSGSFHVEKTDSQTRRRVRQYGMSGEPIGTAAEKARFNRSP